MKILTFIVKSRQKDYFECEFYYENNYINVNFKQPAKLLLNKISENIEIDTAVKIEVHDINNWEMPDFETIEIDDILSLKIPLTKENSKNDIAIFEPTKILNIKNLSQFQKETHKREIFYYTLLETYGNSDSADIKYVLRRANEYPEFAEEIEDLKKYVISRKKQLKEIEQEQKKKRIETRPRNLDQMYRLIAVHNKPKLHDFRPTGSGDWVFFTHFGETIPFDKIPSSESKKRVFFESDKLFIYCYYRYATEKEIKNQLAILRKLNQSLYEY